MEETRNHSENFTLGPLARAGSAENEISAVFHWISGDSLEFSTIQVVRATTFFQIDPGTETGSGSVSLAIERPAASSSYHPSAPALPTVPADSMESC